MKDVIFSWWDLQHLDTRVTFNDVLVSCEIKPYFACFCLLLIQADVYVNSSQNASPFYAIWTLLGVGVTVPFRKFIHLSNIHTKKR